MARTKQHFILATCFLSGAAAIISFVALGTQEWVTSDCVNDVTTQHDYSKVGLFGGTFKQQAGTTVNFKLTTVCAFDLNVCALLCGDDMGENLRKLYNNENITTNYNSQCGDSNDQSSKSISSIMKTSSNDKERIFINAGIWLCTIIFLIISAVMGLFSAGLAVWNTAASPYHVYLSIFGLYIYNAIACFSLLLSVILWGAMFAKDLSINIPSYKTFLENLSTENCAQLGYSYWINLVSLIFYIISICLLYLRKYMISKEPEVKNVQIDDNSDPVIYLY